MSAGILQGPTPERPTPQKQAVNTKMSSVIGPWPPPMSRCPAVGSCQDVQMTEREGWRDEGGEEEVETKVENLKALSFKMTSQLHLFNHKM